MLMWRGLSAFPITPHGEDGLDERAFAGLVSRLAAGGVDSIGALGSTGGYAYLTREERARATRVAVQAAAGVPVMVGIGALRTSHVLAHAEDAQAAGASAVLLAPVSYQPLTEDEVFGLYDEVSAQLSVPLCVYDNPGTTHFTFSDELHGRVAALPNVAAIKVPPVAPDQVAARLEALRAVVPSDVALGISGDGCAAAALTEGADAWFSVIGGLFPVTAGEIVRAARTGDAGSASALSERLEPLWELLRRFGGLRVMSAAAEELDLAGPYLPSPLRGLDESARRRLSVVLDDLGLTG